tara:strand:- start:1369 stop:2556 length:1188 start_codon:yes stop_codon:yes gene_type:complete
MADVLQRYNNATQAYSSGIDSTRSFQDSYNQNFYNDFLEKNAAYKSAVERRDELTKQLKQKALDNAAALTGADEAQASRLIEAGGAALGAYEVGKSVYKRFRGSKEKGGEEGDGAAADAGAAEQGGADEFGMGREDLAQHAEARWNTALANDDLATPPASPRASEPNVEDDATGPRASNPGRINESESGVGGDGEAAALPSQTAFEGEATQARVGQNVAQNLESSNPFGISRAPATESSATDALESTQTAATESANRSLISQAGEDIENVGRTVGGEIGGVEAEAVGALAGEGASEVAAAAAGAGIGEAISGIAAVAPELAGVALVGYGLYDLFHHHHHNPAPVNPADTGVKVPNKPTLNPLAQGATSDIRSTRAEFTTPSFDAVTDVAGSISAF